jgi:hypothetical protein
MRSHGGFVEVTGAKETAPGYAIYLSGGEDPQDLLALIPRMNEPALDDHAVRIRRVLSRDRQSSTLIRWGLVTLGASLGMACVGATSSDMGMLGASAGLSVASLIPTLWGRALKPNPEERTYAYTRQYTFVSGEDDMEAVARGVARLNNETREQCGE